jgi:energy-coupling factor transporter ATP-binding protein EcfA2
VERTTLFGIRLDNFRAYRDPAWFPIRPVTLLFGANSSGKSTFLSAISSLRQSFFLTSPGLVVRGREVDLGPTQSIPHADRPRDDTEIAIFFRLPPGRAGDWNSAIDEYAATQGPHLAGIGLRFNASRVKPKRGEASPTSIPLVGVDAYVNDLDNPLVRFEVGKPDRASAKRSQGFGGVTRETSLISRTVDADHPFWAWYAKTYGADLVTSLGRYAADEGDTEAPWNWSLEGAEDDTVVLADAVHAATRLARETGTNRPYVSDHSRASQSRHKSTRPKLTSPAISQTVINAVAGVAALANLHTTLFTSSWVPVDSRNQDSLDSHPFAARWPPDLPSIHVGQWLAGLGRHTQFAIDRVERVTATRPRAERIYLDPRLGAMGPDPMLARLSAFAQDAAAWQRLQSLMSRSALPFMYEVEHLKAEQGVFSVGVREDDGVVRNLADHGVGVAHLLPVALALLSPERKMLLLEEPESHLHPRMQAAIGSLISVGASDRSAPVIVETHSEHVLRRILRHVQGAAEPRLDPDDVSILYVTRQGGASTVHHLQVGEDGLLADAWPEAGAEDGYREILG